MRLRGGELAGEVRLEHRLDPRRARAALEPGDRALVLHEHERRDDVDLEPLARSGFASTSTWRTRSRLRSFRARWASRLSIRRAGPERSDQKNTSIGRMSLLNALLLSRDVAGCVVSPENARPKRRRSGRRRCTASTLGPRWVTGTRSASPSASVSRSACSSRASCRRRRSAGSPPSSSPGVAGAVVGLLIDDWTEVVAGAAGGVVGALVGIVVVSGALRRGGTRGGLALIVTLVALVLAGLAFVPIARLRHDGRRCRRSPCACGARRANATRDSARSPRTEPTTPPRKLILIVIDGLTPSMFESAVADRRTPTLAFLAEPGLLPPRGVDVPVADARLPRPRSRPAPIRTSTRSRTSSGTTAASSASSSTARPSAPSSPRAPAARSRTRSTSSTRATSVGRR